MQVTAIRLKLGGKLVLSDVGAEFTRGLNVILGPNGSGKTSLLRCIIGMLRPQGGVVEHTDGEKSYAPAEYFSAEMSVLDVLLAGDSKRDYTKYIESLGLRQFLDKSFSSLSTGEKRMVLIAKALTEGDIVLMDEPTSGLDLRNQARLRGILLSSRHKVLVVSTHDISLACVADRVTLLKAGSVLAQGEPSQVLNEETLSRLYDVPVKMVRVEGKPLFVI